ncbi:unnamed protein product [Thlaspi arvense]|uniref:protein disulfide-isomerase n=1 Tax=Thlaspi arvense TaxID=13288 RepID=A0AAU9SIK8_THLAR|nr:unnamed protein product [Thlaspi arvense]
MPNCRFLYHNGVVLEAPPVATFLESLTGAYTTTRTTNGGTSFLFWERHMKRLSGTIRILSNSDPELLYGSSRFSMDRPVPDSSIYDLVNGSMNKALRSVRGRIRGEELAVTVLVTGDAEKLSRLGGEKRDQEEERKLAAGFLHVWLHIGGYSPCPLGAASLALVGHGRHVAAAKYSDWARLRKPLEKFRPHATTELLLSNDGDHLLEGCVTNFFVVCRRVQSSPPDDLYGESLSEFEVQTAPVTDGVLPGVIREVVIDVCLSKGIPYCERAPSWSERELWEEAFITSSLRILQHVGTIKVPVGSLEALAACTKPEEIQWKEKRFEEGPGMITGLIQRAIMERGVEEGFPLKDLYINALVLRFELEALNYYTTNSTVTHSGHVSLNHLMLSESASNTAPPRELGDYFALNKYPNSPLLQFFSSLSLSHSGLRKFLVIRTSMASSTSISLLLFVSFLLLVNSRAENAPGGSDLDEELAFLAAEESKELSHEEHHQYRDFENYEDLEHEGGGGEFHHGDHEGGGYEEQPLPTVDEKDVAVLTKDNLTAFVGNNSFALVEFYAPWCGACQALAPEYAAAATELKGVAALAKIDATEEGDLAQKYEIQGFPSVLLFVDGEMRKTYEGERTKDGIVTWLKKKASPSIHNITTKEEAERVLSAEPKLVLGFLNSLVGSESDELAAASRLEDDLSFYQTASPDIAKLFEIESEAKRPALVLLKKEEEKLARFDGNFTKAAIAEFVSANKVPLVINFTREGASLIFESAVKNQLILFAKANESEKHLPTLREVAKAFKGKFVFVYVQMDNEDYGEAVSGFFGVTGTAPKVLVYTGNEDMRKFILDGELTVKNIKTLAEDFLADKLKPFYKSDPVPENVSLPTFQHTHTSDNPTLIILTHELLNETQDDGDVKIIVGNNFDEIVLDESKDVLLEIYAPWCGYCQSFEPIYNKLGKYLKGIDSLVVAKMDGTTNEHPRAKADGFPTILFFPGGNKSFDPITVDVDRTVVELYKFLKKHASTQFKLAKPATQEPVISTKKADERVEADGVKDEL